MSSGNRYIVRSPFSSRKVGQSGADMCEYFQYLPKVADDICFYRGCQAESVNHPNSTVPHEYRQSLWRRSGYRLMGNIWPGIHERKHSCFCSASGSSLSPGRRSELVQWLSTCPLSGYALKAQRVTQFSTLSHHQV